MGRGPSTTATAQWRVCGGNVTITGTGELTRARGGWGTGAVRCKLLWRPSVGQVVRQRMCMVGDWQ